MLGSQVVILITIAVYLIAMVLIGVYFGKKGSGNSSDDFYLGGRKMGPLVTAMSAEASDMSSYLLMGLPGLAYLCGLPEVSWTCIGLAIGTYLNWLIVARRLRRYSARIGAITVPDFFSRRYGDKKNLLSAIAAVVILVFFIPYTASGFKAIGTLFNSLFGVDYHTAMIIGAIVVIGYTVLGGFMAVSFTDLIQSIFMTIALIVVVVFGIQQAGGVDTVIANAEALPGYLSMTKGYDVTTGGAASFGGLSIISTLTAASSVSQDLSQNVFGIKLSSKTEMIVARATVLVIAAIGITLAWDPNSSVFRVVSFAWAGFGAAFGPVVLFSLFWKRSNKWGALAGMVAGGVMVFVWKYLIAPMGGAWAIYELLPAFVVACIALVVVSLLTEAPEKEIVETYESVCAKKVKA